MPNKIAERLRSLRANAKLADVARVCGRDPQTVSNWENGVNFPPADVIAKLSAHYNVTADYLVGTADHPTATPPGMWLVDQDVVDQVLEGTLTDDADWACPIPNRPRIVSSTEYAALRKKLQQALRGR